MAECVVQLIEKGVITRQKLALGVSVDETNRVTFSACGPCCKLCSSYSRSTGNLEINVGHLDTNVVKLHDAFEGYLECEERGYKKPFTVTDEDVAAARVQIDVSAAPISMTATTESAVEQHPLTLGSIRWVSGADVKLKRASSGVSKKKGVHGSAVARAMAKRNMEAQVMSRAAAIALRRELVGVLASPVLEQIDSILNKTLPLATKDEIDALPLLIIDVRD